MEALFHEILAPPQDAEAVAVAAAAAAEVMSLGDAACMRDGEGERKESGHEEEETKSILERQRQQPTQQDDEMKKILDEMICMTSDEAPAVTTGMPLEYYGSSLDIGLGLDLGLSMLDFDIGGWDVADVYAAAPVVAHSVSGVVF